VREQKKALKDAAKRERELRRQVERLQAESAEQMEQMEQVLEKVRAEPASRNLGILKIDAKAKVGAGARLATWPLFDCFRSDQGWMKKMRPAVATRCGAK
jgi:hypothetical protein